MDKKIFVFNLDVGSAIEHAGDIFIEWISTLDNIIIYEYKEQTTVTHTLEALKTFQPDLIVVNEEYHRVLVSTIAYKVFNPNVKIIYINHCWPDTCEIRPPRSPIDHMWSIEMLCITNHMFCLNYKPDGFKWLPPIIGRVSNRFYPTKPCCYKIIKPWNERKMFCYIGNILPHKVSYEFLRKIVNTNLVIDFYGRLHDNADKPYKDLFWKAVDNKNISYMGVVEQETIPEVMNNYMYLVVPHDGYEPFNWTIKQSIHCGTIPLILNDKESTMYNGNWIHWADGLYLGCAKIDDFISNLIQLEDERPDYSGVAEYISGEVKRRFPYKEFKEEFKNKVRELLDG